MSSHELVRVTSQNLSSVQSLVRAIFPVSYSDAFYKECLDNDLCRVIIHNNEAIAIVAVRPEVICETRVLYVRSLGVHPLHRESGIGTFLINFIDHKSQELDLSTIVLHVQVSNNTAVEFYQKRGYVIDSLIKEYYLRCEPSDAFVMRKQLMKL